MLAPVDRFVDVLVIFDGLLSVFTSGFNSTPDLISLFRADKNSSGMMYSWLRLYLSKWQQYFPPSMQP
ncbi:MAG: hypothetical protein DRQ46_09225 [Gammaproteobacteria bacterium]|nr:MAG: hypothetical protein DRQ46_09225 [Gammaproteobacteria bacterium]